MPTFLDLTTGTTVAQVLAVAPGRNLLITARDGNHQLTKMRFLNLFDNVAELSHEQANQLLLFGCEGLASFETHSIAGSLRRLHQERAWMFIRDEGVAAA